MSVASNTWSYLIVSLLLLLSSLGGPVYGQHKDIHECDVLAAHVGDKQKRGKGVSDEQVDPLRSIKECAQAVLAHPETARFHFQLGRAYWLAQKYPEAIEQFRQAAELQYAPASWYLAEAYRLGVGSFKADLGKAQHFYKAAKAGGFDPAPNSPDADTRQSGIIESKPPDGVTLTTAAANLLSPVKTPRPSVWEAGIPESMPGYDQFVPDRIAVALVFLKHHPAYVTQNGWRKIIEWQLEDDRWYFLRKPFVIHGSGGLDLEATRTRDLDRRQAGYHPTYVPFAPAELFPDDQSESSFNETKEELVALVDSNADVMALFKQWMLRRAELLPPVLVVRASIRNVPSDGYRFFDFGARMGEVLWKPATIPALTGYAPDRMIMTKMPSLGEGLVTRVALLLPDVFSTYSPKLSQVERSKYFAYWSDVSHPAEVRVEYVMTLLKTQLFPVPPNVRSIDLIRAERGDLWMPDYASRNVIDPTPELVIQAHPVSFRLYRADKGAPMAPLTQQEYQIPGREPGR